MGTLKTFYNSRPSPDFHRFSTSKFANSSQLFMLLWSIFRTKFISLEVFKTSTCEVPVCIEGLDFYFVNITDYRTESVYTIYRTINNEPKQVLAMPYSTSCVSRFFSLSLIFTLLGLY